MANLKNITDLPVAESAEGLNLIVNDNGAAKQIAASAVGAQADWAETDETSPAFVKNEPVEEWDLDLTITTTLTEDMPEVDSDNSVFTANETYSYAAFISKFLNGETLRARVYWNYNLLDGGTMKDIVTPTCISLYKTSSGHEYLYLLIYCQMTESTWWILLDTDGTIYFD